MTETTRPTGTTEEVPTGTTDPIPGAAGGSGAPAAGGSGEAALSVEEKLAQANQEIENQKRINAQLLAEKSNRSARPENGSEGAATTGPPKDAATDVVYQRAVERARELEKRALDGDAEAIMEIQRLQAQASQNALEELARQRAADRILDVLPDAYRADARERWESGNYRTPKLASESARDAHEAEDLRKQLAQRDEGAKPPGATTQPQRAAGYAGASDRSVTAPEHKQRSLSLDEHSATVAQMRAAGKSPAEILAWDRTVTTDR